MDARPVLGVPALRPPLLVDLPAAQSREGEAGHGTRVVTNSNKEDLLSSRGPQALLTIRVELEDDLDDDLDEEDDDISDDDEAEDEEDQDDEDADTETWQVSPARGFPLKAGSRLTSGSELPRLTLISQLV